MDDSKPESKGKKAKEFDGHYYYGNGKNMSGWLNYLFIHCLLLMDRNKLLNYY